MGAGDGWARRHRNLREQDKMLQASKDQVINRDLVRNGPIKERTEVALLDGSEIRPEYPAKKKEES